MARDARRTKFNIIAFTPTVLVAVAALVTADLWWRRDHVLKTADTRAANLASVLSEYVRGSFTSADAALRQLAIHAKRIGGPTGSHDDWDPILAAAKAALPESGSITVTNAAGTITHSTVRSIVGESRRDSYVYQRLSSGGLDVGPRRRYGGLGLDLAIVCHLVELHGGTVSAASPGEGQGATFRVLLPLVQG